MVFHFPAVVVVIFLVTVLLTLVLFVSATTNKFRVTGILVFWLLLTGILSYNKVFEDASKMPPRLLFVMVPAIIFIILLLTTKKGKDFTDRLDLKMITLLHVVRIPVEIVLYLLASYKFIPELMTFSGRNFDILSGVSAPIVYFLCFHGSEVKRKSLLLIWNILCLALLLNIIGNALLSAPFPFQVFAFKQPNVAILYFPFTWLPCFVVVIVLYCQLAAIRQLGKGKAWS